MGVPMNLSFRQLMTFREVMRTGSISQAARALGRTQPAVSAMIAGLEDELGFKLFERQQGKLTPQPEARFFLEECDDILSRLEQTKRTLSGISKLEAGHLRIACHPAASGFFLPKVLTEFLSDKPGIRVSLMMRSSSLIEELIASQQFDVGFAETPEPRPSIRQSDFDLECVCAIPAGDELGARPVITPADLDERRLAVLFAEHPTYRQTVKAFDMAGCRFEPMFELQTFLPGMRFVGAGLCYMICDMITAHSHLAGLAAGSGVVVRPFRPRIGSRVSVLTPAHRPGSQLSEAFCDMLRARVEDMQTEMKEILGQPV